MPVFLANPWVTLGLVLGLLGALGGFGLWMHHEGAVSERASWETKVAEQKAEAARIQQEANARLLLVAHSFIDLNIKTEKDAGDALKKADVEHSDNLRLGSDISRLLSDQGRWLSGAYSVSVPAGAAGSGASGPAFAEFLRAVDGLVGEGTRLTHEADDTAVAAIACRAYAIAAPRLLSDVPRP